VKENLDVEEVDSPNGRVTGSVDNKPAGKDQLHGRHVLLGAGVEPN
jgi:hypothetical protein